MLLWTAKLINNAVTDILLRATLDIIGSSALGYELNSLSSYSRFAEAYHTIWEFPALGLLIAFVNQYISIRPWLPLKVNRDFVRANSDVRGLISDQIRKRKREILEQGDVIDGDGKQRDLLTLMIEEKSEGPEPWTEVEILNHVSCSNDWEAIENRKKNRDNKC